MKSMRRQLSVELRELMLLDELERNSHISQRDLAERLEISVGLLNRQLREMLTRRHIRIVRPGVRPFAYRLTRAGKRHRGELRYEHYRSVVGSFHDVEERIVKRLHELKRKGVKRVVFYGAGEVMQVTQPLARALEFEVLALVDDDPVKRGVLKNGLQVQGPGVINTLKPDAVVITTFRHAREIRAKIEPSLRSSVQVVEV